MMTTTAPTTHTDPALIAGWLTPDEFTLLEAICDTFFPSLSPPAGSSATLAAYYQRSARDLDLANRFAETLALESSSQQEEFRQLLALMQNPLSSLLFVRRLRPFPALTQPQREQYLLAMANSPIARLRQGYQAMKRLTGFIFFAAPDAQGTNPNWQVLDYHVPEPPANPSVQSLQPYAITKDTTLECDAVIIGSGAGGGVVAGELATAGKSVIVLEKGGYYRDTDFTLQEAQAMPSLYLKRGTLATNDLSTIILAGSTLGGGTAVNWTTSFRTPPQILDEWDHLTGLRMFTDTKLQDSFSAVEQRIKVNTENSAHNRQNQLLFDGARTLGYHADALRRNALGCEQRCGTCGFGCPYGCKQSTTRTYLQDAYEHGARIIVHCSADRMIIKDRQATGVIARVTDQQTGETYTLTVYARAVIVAAGSIHSPALLLRSGIENKHIGQHLHLHPTSTIAGLYPDSVLPWHGVMQSAYSDEFGYLTGNYGYKLEVPPAHPGLIGLSTPWYSAQTYREHMAQVAHLATFIILTRDKGEGSITLDSEGEPTIRYTTSAFDRRHLLHGLRAAARIHQAAGARAITSLHTKPTRLDLPASEEQLRAFNNNLERYGLGPNRLMMFSAHQMGTCRMGSRATISVVDGNGEIHGIKGLFVCDGSVFPSASGVNPMLTIMALAHHSSQYIKTIG